MTDITRTILLQLGGSHFTTCVGAKNLYEINNGTGLQLDFMKYTYDEIKKKSEPTLIKEVTECYCDQLRRIFENTTKLRTSLRNIYGDEI